MFAIGLMELVAGAPETLELSSDAFRSFYDTALPRVYGYFLHRCGGSVPVAEDLTQETFLAAVAELRKGRLVEAPIPWVYGIARHKLLDHYRAQERRGRAVETRMGNEAVEEPASDDGDERAREWTEAALMAVAPPQRAALVLCYLDGFSAPEIASALGKSTAAVHSLLERGRDSFKRAYLEVSQ